MLRDLGRQLMLKNQLKKWLKDERGIASIDEGNLAMVKLLAGMGLGSLLFAGIAAFGAALLGDSGLFQSVLTNTSVNYDGGLWTN
ncbi:hypothetical protein ACFFK0_15515 [Paenibacillus chartarius]|uniref:Uncharacterized protein n=1 Tax=Paenibacillus chartarius TaxID=747481 RepID=A0ABV6DMH0_9BACL